MLRFVPGLPRLLGLVLACPMLAGCITQSSTQFTAAAPLAAHPTVVAVQQASPCRPPNGPDRTFSPGRPEHMETVRAPERAREDRVNGCAGIMFHILPDGHTTDLRVVAEYPLNYGYAENARRALAAATFPPGMAGARWYYFNQNWVIR